jgi:hypothetical protein
VYNVKAVTLLEVSVSDIELLCGVMGNCEIRLIVVCIAASHIININ